MKQLKPLAGYVLIEPFDEEETTASGLVMPEKEKEKPAKGKVIEMGKIPKEQLVLANAENSLEAVIMLEFQRNVKEGDICIYHRWSGQDIKEGQKEYKLVKFSDLMGVYQ